MAKQMLFDAEAREALRRGFNKLADALRITLGPRGRCVVLDKAFGSPAVSNDGVTIAREIELIDPFENMGAQLGREISSRTQEKVGDGTTTATVLAQALVEAGHRIVTVGANPMGVKRGMDKAAAVVVAEIRGAARPVRGRESMARVATVAAGGDAGLGALVAEALEAVGPDGVVTLESGKGMETTLEIVEGMRFDRGYLSPYFITDADRMVAELDDPSILLRDGKISRLADLLPVMEEAAQGGRPLLVVAEEIEGDALAGLVVNRLRGSLQAAAVKAPGFGDRRRALLEDLAVLTGGVVFAEETGKTLDSVTLADLGRAGRVEIGKNDTTVIRGMGSKKSIDGRAAQIRREIEAVVGDFDREKLQERLARLSGGVGILRIGAPTELELEERRSRAEDALAATRAAVDEGVVPGGGVTLLRAAEAVDRLPLEGDEALGVAVVSRALAAPLGQIADNAGFDGGLVVEEIRNRVGPVGFNAITGAYEDLLKAGIDDPAKVVHQAVMSAVSIAGLILTTQTLVAEMDEDDETGTDGV